MRVLLLFVFQNEGVVGLAGYWELRFNGRCFELGARDSVPVAVWIVDARVVAYLASI